MKKTIAPYKLFGVIWPGSAALLVAACASPVPNYYTLTPSVSALPESRVKVIEVLPVGLPDRLNRVQIVLQDPSGKSEILDTQRWASPLSAELTDSLSTGLQQQLGAVDRYSSGMTGGQVAYRIAVDFSRFDLIGQTSKKQSTTQQIDVAAAWIIKRLDPNVTSTTAKAALAPDRQLNCHMVLTSPVVSPQKQVADAVVVARQSMNQVINAVALSVTALEQGKSVNVSGVSCN